MPRRSNPEVLHLPTTAIRKAVKKFPTPFFIYDEKKIRGNCARFRDTFRKYFPEFAPLYALKANTNPDLVRIIFSEGFGADASSPAEAWVTKTLGGWGMYTGNYTTAEEFRYATACGLLLNLDDPSMLPTIKKLKLPALLCLRINPGIAKGGMKSLILAGPDAKFGIAVADALATYRKAKRLGVKRFGIHTMTGSNVLDARYFPAVAEKLLEIAGEVYQELGIEFEFLNIGGGFGVPYKPEEKSLALEKIARSLRRVFDRQCKKFKMPAPKLMAEPGRWIMADTGWLVGRVQVIKDSYKKFAGIDTSTNNLPRPAFYGAYHHVTVLGKPRKGKLEKINIVGRLCENNDQFARDRLLPKIKVGDFIVIHNAGAHAFAMAHNYNNQLRAAEYLLRKNRTFSKIRRAETIGDLFARTRLGNAL